MYPLNMTTPDKKGFAVANSEAEHKMLSDAGYLPPFDDEKQEPEKRKPGRPRKVEQ